MHKLVTTLLDALGLLLVAAGVTAATYRLVGWSALAAGGVVVLAGSWWADRALGPRPRDGER